MKRNQGAHKTYQKERKEEKFRASSPRFSNLSLSLSLSACLSLGLLNHHHRGCARALVRACVRVCVYKYRATSERGWLRFCAAQPGTTTIFLFSPMEYGNVETCQNLVITFDDETGIWIFIIPRERRIRKEEKRTRFNIKRARAGRTTSLMSC
jgi:hypothetical protein